MDILLTHGYFISEDPHEQKVMKPYAPLGILYISAYLKSRGFAVQVDAGRRVHARSAGGERLDDGRLRHAGQV